MVPDSPANMARFMGNHLREDRLRVMSERLQRALAVIADLTDVTERELRISHFEGHAIGG